MKEKNVPFGAFAAIIVVALVIVGVVAYRMFFTNPYASPLTSENMKEFNDAQKRSSIHQNMSSGGGGRGMHSGQAPEGTGAR